jgi:hypothetical protein
MLAAN